MMGPEIEKQELSFVFNEIEMKLVRVLSDMEQEGFLVDTALLRRLSHQYEKEIAELESSILSGGRTLQHKLAKAAWSNTL